MDLPTENGSLAVDPGEETNTLDLAFSSPLPSMVEEEKEERGNAGAVTGTNPAPPNFGHIDPLPPCMVFFQVHINLDLDLRGFSPGAPGPAVHPPGSPGQLASTSSQLHPCAS